ncbi:MAG TPA: hypothetical protein VFI90_08245 [Rubrobacter sp.]|nr:hypothetical protein [Rubrobacter sp.]
MLERRARLILASAWLLVTLTLVLVGCGSAGSGGPIDKPSSATRTSEGGEVTVAATWKGRSAGPVFEVAMDTHSVDLDGYDLKKLAVLRTGGGEEVRPSAWDAPKGGHHREGTLAFPKRTPGGSRIIGPDTRRIELIIRDVAGVPERRFEWKLQE